MQYAEIIDYYKTELKRYSPEQLRHISEKGVWSIGQMYDHMIATALDYLDQVRRCASASEENHEGKTEAGKEMFINHSFPPIKIKLPDGPANNPNNEQTVDDLLQGLDLVLKSMSQWEAQISAINPNYKVKHEGFGWLNAKEWFEMADMHFRHHLRQKAELEQRIGLC
ncbi:hypothetical protein SD70_00620 [Gordoniibacillus kamchatkensis]|uniref:DinB-like domain-containing protein n=1 Tax=Gordoniibacillus kamchatkensis TaxID=1590651 RepID=A0ABR5ANI9_9BACL|nr:DinB family protein [Paenibacillus sp. VKM B-2647]KIL42545.1 hypothetical protein SD70_00620 [Paenibacillus sp. VKM B-2647]